MAAKRGERYVAFDANSIEDGVVLVWNLNSIRILADFIQPNLSPHVNLVIFAGDRLMRTISKLRSLLYLNMHTSTLYGYGIDKVWLTDLGVDDILERNFDEKVDFLP